jgi:hypothetical protein
MTFFESGIEMSSRAIVSSRNARARIVEGPRFLPTQLTVIYAAQTQVPLLPSPRKRGSGQRSG